jgi:hypothetical protein
LCSLIICSPCASLATSGPADIARADEAFIGDEAVPVCQNVLYFRNHSSAPTKDSDHPIAALVLHLM